MRPAVAMVCLCIASALACRGAEAPRIGFAEEPGRLLVTVDGAPLATYVYADEKITRPYFCDVYGRGGVRLTRNHPPREGDLDDHATMHPGIWLSFGDISGNDYWRLKARTVHDGFTARPEGGPGRGAFAVRNRYLTEAGDGTVCTEVCRYELVTTPHGYLLLLDSSFSSDAGDFAFGDQEEMGLGVRLPTPIAEKSGQGGLVTDSEGREGARAIWGKQADWCDYGGEMDGKHRGITIMPHPGNFRPCWWHTRDYGFMTANPFGRNAMTDGEKSEVLVRPGESLRLRYGVLLHAGPADEAPDLAGAYREYLELAGP